MKELVMDAKDAKTMDVLVVDAATFAICQGLSEIARALREKR